MDLLANDRAVVEAWVDELCTGQAVRHPDLLAVEEPLEIRLRHGKSRGRVDATISITMRTPGHDEELAIGYLFTEGIISDIEDVAAVHKCGPSGCSNFIRLDLRPHVLVDLTRLRRHGFTSSSCGVCGKTSIAAIGVGLNKSIGDGQLYDPQVIYSLPASLRSAQAVFACTGGLHAAGLFSGNGQLLLIREDVGRHNAVDKLIGAGLKTSNLSFGNCLIVLSGRASFELVQKAAVAGIPLLAAVGAPSSLAVDLARRCGMTLLGFVRDDRFNIYTGSNRLGRLHCVPV